MCDVILEIIIGSTAFYICRRNKAGVRAASGDITRKLGIMIGSALSVGAESDTTHFVDCHACEVDTTVPDITNKVTGEGDVSSRVNSDTNGPPANKDVVDDLDVVCVEH